MFHSEKREERERGGKKKQNEMGKGLKNSWNKQREEV